MSSDTLEFLRQWVNDPLDPPHPADQDACLAAIDEIVRLRAEVAERGDELTHHRALVTELRDELTQLWALVDELRGMSMFSSNPGERTTILDLLARHGFDGDA